MIGNKAPLFRSMRGNNDLRGGKNVYNSACLIGNWYEDRLNPANAASSEKYSRPDRRPPHVQVPDVWETVYKATYGVGDWQHKTPYVAPDGIFKYNETGTELWQTSNRADYRNYFKEKQSMDDAERAMEKAQIAATRDIIEERKVIRTPIWPMTPDVALQVVEARDRLLNAEKGDHR